MQLLLLGEKLFLDLSNSLGRDEFSSRLGTLYQITQGLYKEDRKAGIDEVREVFGDQETIIAKHWDGTTMPATPAASGRPTKPPAVVPTTIGSHDVPAETETLKVWEQGFEITYPKEWKLNVGEQWLTLTAGRVTSYIEIKTHFILPGYTHDDFRNHYEKELRRDEYKEWHDASHGTMTTTLSTGETIRVDWTIGRRSENSCEETRITHRRNAGSTDTDRRVHLATAGFCREIRDFEEEGVQVLETLRPIELRTPIVARATEEPTPTGEVPRGDRLETPKPLPTQTPTPIPTATLIPTATQTPVPTPMPTSTPTPIPTATPIPTPTPVPPPVLEIFDNTAWKEYTVMFPTGWSAKPGLDLTTFTSPDGRQRMEIGRYLVQFHESVNDLAEAYRNGIFEQAPGWDHFTEKSARGEFITAGNAVIITFDRRKTSGDCTEDGITHLLRSKFFPERSIGYAVTMSVCQEDLGKWEETRRTMMESFAEQ